MGLVRKLFLLGAMTLAALALTAGSASAQLEVHSEFNNDECGEVVEDEGHQTIGGCHAEFQSTVPIPLNAYIPAKTTVFLCDWHIEAQIGEDGSGYVTEALLTEPPAPPASCTRTACDEAETAAHPHEDLLWSLQIEEDAGQASVELTFCLRTVGAQEGTAGTSCTVHLELNDLGGHEYEIGDIDPSTGRGEETFCEAGGPPFPVSIEAHFVNEDTDDDPTRETVEIIH